MIDYQRIFMIFITQLGLSVIFLIISQKILKRNRSRLTYTLNCFYYLIAIAFIINAIEYSYIILQPNLQHIQILLYLIFYLIFLSPIFIILFHLLLLESEKIITLNKQILIIGIYALLLFCLLYFSGIVLGGFSVEEQSYRPLFSSTFFLISLGFVIIFITIPSIYSGIQVSRQLTGEWKKKFFYFRIGLILLNLALINLLAYNTFSFLRTTGWIIAFVFVILGGIFFYRGFGDIKYNS